MSATPNDIPRLAAILTTVSENMARVRGAPVLLGALLVLANFILQFIPALGWFADYNVLLHLGVIMALLGALFSSAL